MGMVHAALWTIVLLVLCALITNASSGPQIQRSIVRTSGALKQAPSKALIHDPSATTVTKIRSNVKPPIVIGSAPPTISTNNGTNNNTLKIELCLDCVAFMQNNLQNLVNIVTKIGVADTCAKICNQLNSTVDQGICNAMCTTIGVQRFWQLFVSAGINPIYACEMLDACTAGTSPAVTFTNSAVTPTSGAPGTVFEFKVSFTVVNETGVGETAFVVYYPVDSDHELGFISQNIFADYTPGEYEANLSFPTNSTFNAGKYLVMFDFCSGACGQDPDPYPFATEEFTFNITSAL